MDGLGKALMGLGSLLFVVGGLIWLGGRMPGLRLGRLPGDIAIQRPGFSFFFPLGTCILLSLLLTALMWLAGAIKR